MADPADKSLRRLTTDFAAWLDDAPAGEAEFYKHGLIVLDTNALLDLYRVNPKTRTQVIKALTAVGDRLWVPHQVAVEFSRNRKQAVIGWQDSLKKAGIALRDAPEGAIDVLDKALAELERLRRRSGTSREWDLASVGLDRNSLMQRLHQVMDPALAELQALEADRDLYPKDMTSIDPVLKQIDDLLAGRIGGAYSSSRLRELVDEAIAYRYPNKIPPGYRDGGKDTDLRHVGDFLLWQQTIDRANLMPPGDRLVLVVTQETKPDWWQFDSKGNPCKPLPMLVQEMRDSANAHLRLASLADFMDAVGTHITVAVSEETVEDLRRVERGVTAYLDSLRHLYGSNPIDLFTMTPTELELIVLALLHVMGYPGEITAPPDMGFDIIVRGHGDLGSGTYVVEVNRWRNPVDISKIHALYGVMVAGSADGAAFVTTSRFRRDAREFAEEKNIHLIEGNDLVRLLAEHLGLNTRLGPPPAAPGEAL